MAAPLLDPGIRALLLPQLQAEAPASQLVQELEIGGGHADVAVIHAARIDGYEIKSASDTVRRLHSQVPQYGRVFHRCTLVTAPNHVRVALGLLPSWWGISVVEDGAIAPARPAIDNPDARPARLLWTPELQLLVRQHCLRQRALEATRAAGDGRVSKWHMATALHTLPREQAAALVCTTLRARSDWRLPDGRSVLGAQLRARRHGVL